VWMADDAKRAPRSAAVARAVARAEEGVSMGSRSKGHGFDSYDFAAFGRFSTARSQQAVNCSLVVERATNRVVGARKFRVPEPSGEPA
jgi:hypothetical protein